MNTASLPAAPWTQRRWLYTICLAFLAHVALIFLLADRPQPLPAPSQFRTAIHLVVDAQAAQRLAESVSDPALFALPNHHGFSGEAWLKYDKLPYQWTDWTEPPGWLPMDAGMLGKTYARFLATNISPPLMVADKPLPALIRSNPNLNPVPVARRSEWRIEGELVRRPLLTPFDLPPWEHNDILTNSVVQMLVNADGNVVSPAVLAGSGSIEADQYALKLARSAHFQPLRLSPSSDGATGPLMWGNLVCQWHTVAPSLTNLLKAKP